MTFDGTAAGGIAINNQDQALLRAILETAVDAIIVIDHQGIIQLTNPATTTLFGYQRDEMVGQNVKMLMPDPYRDQHDGYVKHYNETMQAKIIGIGREVVGKRKDESTFPIHLAVSEIAVGERRLFAGIIRDISDLKRAQQQLSQANERLEQHVQQRTAQLRDAQAELVKSARLATLGQVSGGIAHEIRNPLNAVRTSVYYLRHAKDPSPEKIDEHLGRIDRQVSLIDNVITALTDIARLPEPAVSAFDLAELTKQVLSTVTLPENIAVVWESPPVGVEAVGDPNQISIVIRNLIRNARDAMPTGGTLSMAMLAFPDVCCIQISDTGVGISEQDVGRVTEPLFSTKARGMGLGLSISVEILKKNRGRLEVESRIGQGTTFSVYLPQPSGP